jgi:hypothetical protein
MADIFNEIEEDLRRERMARLWKRFGPLIVTVAVLIVVGVAGMRAWEWYSAKQAEETGARFEAALALARQDNNSTQAEAALDAIAKDGPAGYALLARFRAAGELALTNKAAAAARFEEIAQDISVPALARDLARVRAALILVDTGSQADVASRAEPLAVPGNAWRHSAREILALSAWKAGNVADTRRWAQELISDAETPQGARAIGQLLLDLASGADVAGSPMPEATGAPVPSATIAPEPVPAEPIPTAPVPGDPVPAAPAAP